MRYTRSFYFLRLSIASSFPFFNHQSLFVALKVFVKYRNIDVEEEYLFKEGFKLIVRRVTLEGGSSHPPQTTKLSSSCSQEIGAPGQVLAIK